MPGSRSKRPSPAPKPPSHLSSSAKRFWRRVLSGWDLSEAEYRLLQSACEAWDRSQEARRILKAEGLVFHDRFGSPRAHPAAAIERDSRIAFARLVRQLGLEQVEPPTPDRRFDVGKRAARAAEEDD